MRSFLGVSDKLKKSMAIKAIRDELTIGNIHLEKGGIRSHHPQLQLCVAAFSCKLHRLGYEGYDDHVDDVVKQALKSVLKTESRKSVDKAATYKQMIQAQQVRVKRVRMSLRMLSAYGADQAFREISPEVRTQHEEVRFVFIFNDSTSCVLQVLKVEYMPFVCVESSGFKLTPLAWLSDAALKVQHAAVDLLNARSCTSKYKDQYIIR
jgi:hypothetical protein